MMIDVNMLSYYYNLISLMFSVRFCFVTCEFTAFACSIHGLIRGENMELGRDSDTGGQVILLFIFYFFSRVLRIG
jgi:hypothetical protein